MKENSWQKNMYDHYFADSTLNSQALRQKAIDEVDFIIKQINLKTGSVLDVPCGTGRHSYLLAKKGFKVTGIDISEACLKIANKSWGHKNLSYQIGDMSNLKHYKNHFNLVLNLFTSFGYFATDKQNEQVLKELYNSLRDDGTLVLNLINRNWLLKVYRANDWQETEDKYILNRRLYDSKTHYNEAWMTVIDKKTKEETTYYHRNRLYSKNEIVLMLKQVGFKKISVVGDHHGNKFNDKGSTHPFFFALK